MVQCWGHPRTRPHRTPTPRTRLAKPAPQSQPPAAWTPRLERAVPDDEALRLVMKLMAIPGRSGQEALVMEALQAEVRRAGLPDSAMGFDRAHARSRIDGESGNLIVKLRGTTRGPRRMLSAHVDTVPICVGAKPKLRGRVVVSADPETGLGADDRAGAAVLLCTLVALARAEAPHPPLTFLWTVQEEAGMFGARHVALGRLGAPKLAFNFDGGAPHKLTIGATSGYRMTIDVRGIASHAGGAPQDGVSAIAIAALAIADLTDNGWHGQIEKGRRTGTSNVGVIQGGAATNVVTDRVLLRAEARSHDPEFRGRIVAEIEKAFRRAAKRVTNSRGKCGDVRFDGTLDYEAFRLSPTQECVSAAQQAVRAVGAEPELAVANGGLDANWLTHRGIPTVSLGCGQRNIHTADEELDVAEFHLARRIALRLATD